MSHSWLDASKIGAYLLSELNRVKLTVDCVSTGQLFAMPETSVLAYLLSKANVRTQALPLEALVCTQSGLQPVPDYPIAAIAAAEDGLDVGTHYWLRAEPVHLLLQRDSFSLSEPCPLAVAREHAQAIITSLNAHFAADGLTFALGQSGVWYLSLKQPPSISTALPAMAMGKNVAHFMPQGADAKPWVAYLNEVQMLLHAHAANAAREAAGEVAINSIWLSGGGVMPSPLAAKHDSDVDALVGSSALYQGLAKCSGLMYHHVSSVQDVLSQLAGHAHVRMQLTEDALLTEDNFQDLLSGLKNRSITQLVLNLACYDQTLVATIKPLDLYKFWRATKPMSTYLV